MSVNSFTLLSDATIVAPKTFTLTSDAYIVSGKVVILLSDAVIRSGIGQINLTSDAVIVPFVFPTPQYRNANSVPCVNALKDCLPCNDDPVANYSSEAPDPQVFCAVVTFTAQLPLGMCGEVSATEECCSLISQQDAYLCALKKAQQTVWGSWKSATCPPPGCPPNCLPDCPPVCGTEPPFPPPPPPPPPPIYTNSAQICSVECGDGSSFSWEVPAGIVVALSQAEADAKAFSLACAEARRRKICFGTQDLPLGRAGSLYLDSNGQPVKIVANGGTPFVSPQDVGNLHFPTECTVTALPFGTLIPYHYEIIYGALPNGLSFDCFGVIKGSPNLDGNYSFTVKVTDAVGSTQTKDYQIVIGCSPNPLQYQDSGYRFLQIASDFVLNPAWTQIVFDDASWTSGQGAFGSGGSCPLQSTVHSNWNLNTDLAIRRKLTLPAGLTNLKLHCSVDNKIVEIWFNNHLLDSNRNHDGCPAYDDFVFSVPDGYLVTGTNLIAVRVRDLGIQSFFDMKATVDCP